MKIQFKQETESLGFQDGAIYKDTMFWFHDMNKCDVYDLKARPFKKISEFVVDKEEKLIPHFNAVTFGNEFYEKGDEFPLLYGNMYNNYASQTNAWVGVCCVYRVLREGNVFSLKLVQLIRIGFTEDREYWRSEGEVKDVRPYGNFVVDREKSKFYAYVMRDGSKTTRYFAFDLPKVCEGEYNEELGVNEVTLTTADIKDYFDTPYHQYIQGGCMHEGKIYEVEGFTNNEVIRPAIRVIDPAQRKQIYFFDFFAIGMKKEAEFIDFYEGECYYGTSEGILYTLDFNE